MIQEKIIQLLKRSSGYLSGEAISRQLSISRSGVWKNIQELRRDGYGITAVPHEGYRLENIPDKLFTHEIRHGLGTRRFGRKVESFNEVSSTMDLAFQVGINGASEGTLICAESQTRGRGRMGRSWFSPPGQGLYFSVILRPPLTSDQAAKLTLLSAVAVGEALREGCGCDARIKWPNDLQVQGRKLCGILTEMRAEMDQVLFVVVGVGVNVHGLEKDLPPGATSLEREALLRCPRGKAISRVAVLQNILRSFEKWVDGLYQNGFGPALDEWRRRSDTLGRRVRVGELEGTALDIDEYGGLIIRNDKGTLVRRMSGDVTYPRMSR
jgi:BirA family biotin operon repressor/biotin-[acetyl-CoA-carboxylase] ligase